MEYKVRQKILAEEGREIARRYKGVTYIDKSNRERPNGQLNKNFQVMIMSKYLDKTYCKLFHTIEEAIWNRDLVYEKIELAKQHNQTN